MVEWVACVWVGGWRAEADLQVEAVSAQEKMMRLHLPMDSAVGVAVHHGRDELGEPGSRLSHVRPALVCLDQVVKQLAPIAQRAHLHALSSLDQAATDAVHMRVGGRWGAADIAAVKDFDGARDAAREAEADRPTTAIREQREDPRRIVHQHHIRGRG